MFEPYLDDLERRARWTLASREVEVLLVDAREHLDASLQARLELGDAPDTAEQGAVAAFGHPKDLVQAANAVHRARFQGLFLGLSTVGGVAWAFAMLASPALGSWAVVVTGLTFFAMLGCFVEASKVRRSAAPLAVATVAFWLAFAFVCAAWTHDFSLAGWLSPRTDGPADLPRAAGWAGVAALAFLAYLLLAYRMARPAASRRARLR